jgi:hypothetical protein
MIAKATLALTAVFGLMVDSSISFSFNTASSSSEGATTPSPPYLTRKNFLQVSSSAALGAAIHFPQQSQAALDISVGGKPRFGDESIMSPKEHGTSSKPVQTDLLYDVSTKLADKVRVSAIVCVA